jgi:hypothetical protein
MGSAGELTGQVAEVTCLDRPNPVRTRVGSADLNPWWSPLRPGRFVVRLARSRPKKAVTSAAKAPREGFACALIPDAQQLLDSQTQLSGNSPD